MPETALCLNLHLQIDDILDCVTSDIKKKKTDGWCWDPFGLGFDFDKSFVKHKFDINYATLTYSAVKFCLLYFQI